MAEIAPLAEALQQISELLDAFNIPYMVIGGVANVAWGEPRSTQDIDITVAVDDDRVDELIDRLGRSLEILPVDPRQFLRDTRVLPLATRAGVRIDLIRAGLPFEEN